MTELFKYLVFTCKENVVLLCPPMAMMMYERAECSKIITGKSVMHLH
jgi:hypothetical protein